MRDGLIIEDNSWQTQQIKSLKAEVERLKAEVERLEKLVGETEDDGK